MRVDNGLPLGAPSAHFTPLLALWLIGIDVDMIWNKPACPQQNGRVEKMQDTTARWAEIHKATSLLDLQARLNGALQLQREAYPVLRLEGQTRLMAFPTLATTKRPYSSTDFTIGRVYTFLQPKLYTRKVSNGGQITHYGKVYSVGVAYKQQWVQVRLSADGSLWEVLSDYKVIKQLDATMLSAKKIEALTPFKTTKHQT